MTARASWAQKFLAPFKEPKMHDDDKLQSGAGGGEELHPDQDNAPAIGLNPGDASEIHNAPAVPPGIPEVEALHRIAFEERNARFKAAAREVYVGNPNFHAIADRLADAWSAGEVVLFDGSNKVEQQIYETLTAHLSRS